MEWDAPITVWEEHLKAYSHAIKVRGESTASRSELSKLDHEVRNFGDAARRRDPESITRIELSKIVSWKLKRGKFRPRLQKLADSNTEKAVTDTSSRAFSYVKKGDLTKALKALEELSGIGPATASAVLSIVCPSRCAFMSDEALAAAPALNGRVDYTNKAFKLFQEDMISKSRQLEELSPHKQKWTPVMVENAIWSSITRKQLDNTENLGSKPKRRKVGK
ncbi:hypothetical protein NDN08_004697 [Rhodosorus marinus]|uniref:HhH-GPD domain-containing protein n=1 Tax=Rhodosorus marinus TaxID=101924 RepID=A0AAV8UR76_9RHOD|nr:hypothetical protein NDN08_004697 [Rhodosorus marinus]